ncbi:MAG: M6 family metalloprotease domain-containing protein [Fusobacteriota bacterium]
MEIKKIIMLCFLILNLITYSKINYAPPHPDLLKNEVKDKSQRGEIKRTYTYTENIKRSTEIQTLKAPVLLIRFEDDGRQSYKTQDYFNTLLFSEENTHSLTNYYKEVSNGKLSKIDGDISNWVMSKKNMQYYGSNDGDPKIKELIKEAIDLSEGDINFSDFTNEDGIVERIIVVHSGKAEEETGNSSDIYSHQWSLNGYKTKTGVTIENYTLQSMESPIGIFAHEFGHTLGLPDLYSTTTGASKIGEYSLMDYGSWSGPNNNDGTVPSHLSAWEKVYLGWLEPRNLSILNDGQKLSIREIQDIISEEDYNYIYKIDLDDTGKEYLLIENRQKQGWEEFDSYLPGSGLLIYHIIEGDLNGESMSDAIRSNTVNSKTPLRVKVLEADGFENLINSDNYGESGDYFRSDTNSQLLPYPNNNPNSCLWNPETQRYDIPTDVRITQISSSANMMTFKFISELDIKISDINQDGVFDIHDIIKFRNEYYGAKKVEYDFNDDGIIDNIDLQFLKDKAETEFENLDIW